MEDVRMLPYGISDFEDLRSKNRYCVDKSMYIPKLETAGDFLFLIRPRRFGKSIFLSMLKSYYDMASAEKFGELFNGMWIHEHPTNEQGQYQVIYLDFSRASSGRGDLEDNFHRYCSIKFNEFAQIYEKYYDDGFRQKVEALAPYSVSQLEYIYGQAKIKGHNLYLIIDEYDNFTNDVLSEQGQEMYHALTHSTGFYREMFKKYKGAFKRILMMGVSPVTMDDLTSGYNISTNITFLSRFNMMLGFSETDVREMIEYYHTVGMITEDTDKLISDMKPWYDNYCFAKNSLAKDPKMFNCDMVVYYLNYLMDEKESPLEMVDPNTTTDYNKLKQLIKIEKHGNHGESIIKKIVDDKKIDATPASSFPAERIYDKENFVSLLYYYGMLTMVAYDRGKLTLGIPNNNVRMQYYKFLLEEYQKKADISLQSLVNLYWDMAYEGKWQDALRMIAESYRETSSVRSSIEGERNIQGYFTAYMSLNKYYLTAPEIELGHGYCDIFLLPDLIRFPEVEHSYIIEIKYISADDSKEGKTEAVWQQAIDQLEKYKKDEKLKVMCHGTPLHCLALLFNKDGLARMEEVCQ